MCGHQRPDSLRISSPSVGQPRRVADFGRPTPRVKSTPEPQSIAVLRAAEEVSPPMSPHQTILVLAWFSRWLYLISPSALKASGELLLFILSMAFLVGASHCRDRRSNHIYSLNTRSVRSNIDRPLWFFPFKSGVRTSLFLLAPPPSNFYFILLL